MTVTASSPISGSSQKRYARVLSIAGSDSGGGAGIQADLKTCAALGCYGMTAITAITVQNTLGVTGIHGIPLNTVRDQIDAVVSDIGVDAVKIGMLATPEVVSVVADAMGAPSVLLKGGHLNGDVVMDVLGLQGQTASDYLRLQSQRIVTHNGHGTGCTLSSAIASFLAQGLPLAQAVTEARRYILGAIEAGADVYTGHGHGPLNHGYAPRAQRIVQG